MGVAKKNIHSVAGTGGVIGKTRGGRATLNKTVRVMQITTMSGSVHRQGNHVSC